MLPSSIEVKLGSNFSRIKLSPLLQGRRCSYLFGSSPNLSDNFREGFKTFASRKSERKRRKDREVPQITLLTENIRGADCEEAPANTELPSGTTSGVQVEVASRSAVLQACILTSAGLLLFGVLIRQVSHLAYTNGLQIHDATEVKFGFETWHIGLVLVLVVLISSSRYILLKAWPDFAESSEAANQQVLGSLEPLDLPVVALLPGISEELLFRGGLMPPFGLDWKSALATGAFFGILHLNGGRKYSYAIWATIVGFAYGLATVVSSSLVVPMASHSLNNLIGGLVWWDLQDVTVAACHLTIVVASRYDNIWRRWLVIWMRYHASFCDRAVEKEESYNCQNMKNSHDKSQQSAFEAHQADIL